MSKDHVEVKFCKKVFFYVNHSSKIWLGQRSVVVFLTMCLIGFYIYTQKMQNSQFHPDLILADLETKDQAIRLEKWNVALFYCDFEKMGHPCLPEPLFKKEMTLPNIAAMSELVKTLKPRPNLARIEHVLTDNELRWLEKLSEVGLVIPRSVQSAATLFESDEKQGGLGASLTFFTTTSLLKSRGKIEVEFAFNKLPFFGPMEMNPILVVPRQIGLVQGLGARLESLSGFQRQFVLSTAIAMMVLGLFLDTSVLFRYLSFMAFFFASRSFLWTLVESGDLNSSKTTLFLASTLTVCYCLSLLGVALVFATGRSFESSKRVPFVLFAAVSVLGVASFIASPRMYLMQDEICESLTSLACLFVLIFYRAKNVQKTEIFGLKKRSIDFRFVGLVLAFLVYFQANAVDVIAVYKGGIKDLINWGHTFFQPALLCLGFFEVGVVSKQVRQAASALLQKIKTDKEIEQGRSYQQSLLPLLKGNTKNFKWRAWYKPASRLAGDWIDVRELTFSDGKTVLVAIVVDVAGHGTAAALTTTVLSSHWTIWCKEAQKAKAPQNQIDRDLHVQQALSRLDDGIGSGQIKGCATAVMVILDGRLRELTLGLVAHPRALICGPDGLKLLAAPQNDHLGRTERSKKFETVCHPFLENETLVLHTDGLFPPGEQTLGKFVKSFLKTKNPKEVLVLLLKNLRKARKIYRANDEIEDDISLVYLSYNNDKE